MTQQQLAEKVGVSQQYIALLEIDNIVRTRSPKLSMLLSIAIALKVCPHDILFYECNECALNINCQKRDYLEEENDDDYDFFRDNLTFYL